MNLQVHNLTYTTLEPPPRGLLIAKSRGQAFRSSEVRVCLRTSHADGVWFRNNPLLLDQQADMYMFVYVPRKFYNFYIDVELAEGLKPSRRAMGSPRVNRSDARSRRG